MLMLKHSSSLRVFRFGFNEVKKTKIKNTNLQIVKNDPIKFYLGTMLLFLALGFLVYASSLNHPFVMDDEVQVVQNTHIQTLNEFSTFFTSSSMDMGGKTKMGGIYYKPLMTSYYAIIWNFFGARPSAFRLPLLLIHILSSYLIFIFSMSFLSKNESLFLGLLFLIHPVNTEVVVYIADAQDIFYFFFGVVGLNCIDKIEDKKRLFATLLLFFSFGLLSKETGVLFLFIGSAYAFFLRPHKRIPVFAAAMTTGFFYGVIRLAIGLTNTRIENLIFHSLTFFERLRMLPLILGHYIEIFFFPLRLSLSTDFAIHEFSWRYFWQPLILLVFFGAILFKIVRELNQSPYKKQVHFFLTVIILWFILHGQMLVPLDGVYADRWFYIGVWGLSSLLMIYFHHKFSSLKLKIILGLILIIFSARSYVRSLDWEESLNLYTRESELHPWDATMNNNVGVELFRQNKIKESESYFLKATELNPKWSVAWNNLGAVLEQKNDLTGAMNLYLKSANLGYSLAFENYTQILIKMGENEKANTFLKEKALPLYPQNTSLLRFWKMLNP